MGPSPRQSRANIPSFEAKLENEEEVLDSIVSALSKNALDAAIWDELHDAAVKHDRVSELAFAYESAAQSRKLKTFLPAVQAELFFRAATFFGDVLGDEFGATTYLERALGAFPGHVGAFERIDAQLTRTDDNKKLAELCVQTSAHHARPDQIAILKRAAHLFERASLEDKAIETFQQLVRLDPADEELRNALEARFVRANRYRDVARMFEQALAADPPPPEEEAARIRQKLIEVFANQLKEPERAMPHVEALLESDPANAEARRVAHRLLESKGLAARAAAALSAGATTTEERARYLGIELEHTRGPRRRDVLRRIGVLKQDELDDTQGAFEAFEQALGIDPADDELRQRYMSLGIHLKGPLEVARTFARVSTVAKDAGVRSRITAEMGDLLLRGGDTKRARTTLAGVLSAPSADPGAVLTAARALSSVYESEGDVRNLVEVLQRIGELSPLEGEKQLANERIAEICTNELGDVDRAIGAWRRLVDSPARARALEALEPLYEAREQWIDLSFVLEERAKDAAADPAAARALSYRAAEVLTTKAKDVGSASEAWRQMIAAYGPARDVYAQWLPLLEQQRLWPELAEALTKDAELAPEEERPLVLARLGNVYLQRTRDTDAAIDAFKRALDLDAAEKTSRGTLEKLLLAAEHRLAASAVLEPIYRGEQNAQGLLRVLDIRASSSPIVQDRLAALEEAARVAESVSKDKTIEVVARGLAESVESQEPIGPWLERFTRAGEGIDPKRRAAFLGKALGDRPIESRELLGLAVLVGEESYAAGDVAAALAAYRRALAFEPSSTDLIARVDQLLQEQGNPEERVALYRAALERGADPARRRQLLHSIGTIERYELMNPTAAIGAYRRAVADDPTDREANSALVELYTETEAWDELCDLLEDYLAHATSPEETRAARAQLAQVATAHGQGDRGALHAGALLNDPNLGEPELDLVEHVATTLSDKVLLRAVLERRVRESEEPQKQVECLERLATLAQDSGDASHAVERLRQAADVAQGMGDAAAAVALYGRLRAIAPRDEHATGQLVDLHERAGSWEAVPPLYSVLLELATDTLSRVALLRRLSRTLADQLGDLERAFNAAKSALALAPEDGDALSDASSLAIRTGRTAELAAAIDEALAATTTAPEATRAELTLAKARVLATQEATWGEAAAAFRAVLEDTSDEAIQAAASQAFTELLRAMPRSQAKTRDVRWLHGWRVDHAPADQRARALLAWAEAEELELGHEQTALELYKKVLEIDESELDALSAVSRLSLAHGDVEGALAALMTRRAASEGDAKNALDVQIATILVDRPGRADEALDRIAGVLENTPQDAAAIELAARLLGDHEVAERAAKVLETSLDAVDDPDQKIKVFDHLIARPGAGGSAPRRELYERYLDTLAELERPDAAYAVALRAVRALPAEQSLWDRAEQIARQLSSAEPLADTYEAVLRLEVAGANGASLAELARAANEPPSDDALQQTRLAKADAIELGQRAVAFYEEWYEDSDRVVRVLERLLEIEPEDTWAFDRLKLIFDSKERWDDLFALYDRAAASADKDRKFELLEEAAQIAKDFANHAQRAIRYFEQLLELRPGNVRLSSALERLYERHGCHRELITLRGMRLLSLPHDEAQKERSRIATLWLDELNDASSALIVVEDIVVNQNLEVPEGAEAQVIDVTPLLERVLATAPRNADIRETVPPPPDGRRDSYVPTAPKRGLVRQRAAALLKERYAVPGKEADLARVLEVELEVVKSVKERIRRHHQIAGLHAQLGNDEAALEHFVQLVLLEPEVASHRQELAAIAARIGRFDRLAEVLVSAADDAHDDALKVELLMSAGDVAADEIGDIERAIELFFRVLAVSPIADAALLEACRHVEPLLEKADRRADRLDVLERLAILEQDADVKWRVLGEAARLAMGLEEDDRAIWAWEGRLETRPGDPEALDGLAFLFEKAERWRPLIDTLDKRARRDDRDAGQRREDRIRVAQIQSEKLEATEEAIETWRDVEATFGHSEDGTRALAGLYRLTKRWEELAELLGGAAARAATPADKADTLRELGDVQREELGQIALAIASYELSLTTEPRNEGSRSGLRSLIKRSEHRAEVVRVLLAAYVAADDWKLILDITEHRLSATHDTPGQIAVLMEAARISEDRADDADAAFTLVRRALLLDPSQDQTVAEIFRLADKTRAWRPLADALRECIDGQGDAAWARALRFRMGEVLEARLDEPRPALDAYVHVADQDPGDLESAKAVIRVAGKTSRWDAAARALVEATRARDALERDLVEAVEDAAQAAAGWDAVTFALASLIHDGGGLSPGLARDLEDAIAVWHRDRRGDPDAAEAAYARALAHDPTNAPLLAELAKLQRRARGRPLVDSLLRLSQTTGGDLDLLGEAAEVAVNSVGDRALAKSIFDRLLKLAAERWLGATEPNVLTSGTPDAPEHYVDRATRELVRIYGDDGDHDKVVQLLTDTAHLPWKTEKARALRHEAARVAVDKLGAADRAIAIYLALIEEDPHDAEAVSRVVALYEAADRRTELLDLKRRLVGTARDVGARLELRLEVAALEDGLDSVPRAIDALRENLGESARHDATVKMLAAILQRERRVEELEALLASQAQLGEDAGDKSASADFFWRAAEVAEKQMKDPARAIAHLRRVVALEERPPAYDALARLSTDTRAYDDAAGFLDRLRELTDGPARAAVTLRLADALVSASRKPEARERLESEIARDPEADSVRVRLAETYRAAQDWPALAVLLTEGAHHAPDKATRLARLREAAELHRARTNEPDKAIPLLEQASDLSPDDNAVKLALADALGAASRFEEARTLLRTLVEAFGGRRPKERAPVHYHLARLDLAVGDRARALVELDAATRIDPANPEILQALAELARDDGQLERAERSYRALLTVLRRQEDATDDAAITRSEALFELAQIATRQGESDRAKEILESAFELALESAVEARRLEGALRRAGDHVNLARALGARLERGGAEDEAALRTELGGLYDRHLDKKDEALEMILRAIDLEPANEAAHDAAFRLAGATGKMASYETRVRDLAEAKADSDGDLAGMLYLRLARIAESEAKEDREVAALYEKAVAARPEDRELLSALAGVYERLGDDAGQARVLGMRVELDTAAGGASPDALYRLAQLRFRSGDVDAGCDAFELAFEADPDADRAEELLRAAADAHPSAERIVDVYERLARAPGRERSLVDALVRRWSLPGAGVDPMKEAVEIAEKLEDAGLAESLLRRFLERERPRGMSDEEYREGRVWALALLAWRCEESGRVREAAVLKREAAEIAEPEAARRFLFEVAGLASGPLDDLRLASSIYEELHEKEPQDRDAWELLLDVYRRLDDFSKLVALVARIVEFVDDVGERSKLRLERVKVQMQKLKLSDDDAAEELRDIVDEDPAQVDAALLLVNIYEKSGREDDLADLLARQLDGAKDRQDAEAVGSLSRRLGQLLEKRDRSQARDVYYAALDWDPQARAILLALERLHDEDADIEARSDVMERRLAIEHGDEAEALALSLHDTRRALEDNEGALRSLELGFRGAPRSMQLRDRLEIVYRDTNEYGKLAELFTLDARGRQDAKEKSARLREAAQIYSAELSNPEEAAKVLREARAADPSDALLLIELVDTLSAAGELRGAVDELTSALNALDPDAALRPDLVGRRALARSRLGEMDGALEDFEEAVAKGKHDLRAYFAEHLGKMALQAAGRGDVATWRSYRLRIAGLRLDIGDVEEARNVLTELLKTDSKDKATLRAIAHVDELEGRWDTASATYRRLVGLEDAEGIVSAALKLLETCEKAGRLADARGGLERARMAAPDDAELRERLAWLYEQLGALKELAELVLEEARAAGDVAPRFEGLVRAGQLFLEAAADPNQTQQLDNTAAIAPLEEAHALRPSDLDCAALLSDAYVAGGRIDEAQELLLRTIGTFKGRRARELSALYHRLARIAEILGDRATELQHLTTALDMDAQNGVVASELAYLAMETQNLDVAQRALRQITMLKVPAPLPKAVAYQHLGEIARQQGDNRRAMMLLKRAIDDDPSLDDARALLEQLQAEG
ncbi:MAG: tetratricopeptide repeat protein [Labilithrix sp.]|nr:tetratricopeptide repeat protein [Labilithrix sp.]